MRVLVTGMGGELGTRVALLLEAADWVDDVVGIDGDPPRRRLRRAEFVRVDPRDRAGQVAVVREVRPEAVLHVGTYEPNARAGPAAARSMTLAGTISALGAAADLGELRHVVVRSGIEVYGRGRGTPTRPAEDAPLAPTSAFGRTLTEVEAIARAAAAVADATLAVVRLAPVVGPHVPSPLGRLLRLPVVPVGLADPPFSLVHQEDAAAALVAALARQVDGVVNVVGAGAVTAAQASRMGGRVRVPVVGPGWLGARALAELAGAPVPEHVRELLARGRTAEGSRTLELLGATPARSTPAVVKELYRWAGVVQLPVDRARAA